MTAQFPELSDRHMDYAALRAKMVESQLKTEGVLDPAVLAAFAAVPRERFVPDRMKPVAYLDRDLMIKPADATSTGRYLMAPSALGRLVQAAQIEPDDTVLIIGAGVGYSSAIVARLARGVAAVEADPSLATFAERVLSDVGNVAIVSSPLAAGYPKGAPYDVILIDGAVEVVPEKLFDQLDEGGRLVAIIGVGLAAQGTVYTRTGSDVGRRPVFNTGVHLLPGFEKPAAFVF